MLTLSGTDEKQSTCFLFVGANSSNTKSGGLITSNTNLICLTDPDQGWDTCSFYSGPSDSTIASIGSSYNDSGECAGVIASSESYSGVFGSSGSGECAGVVASSGSSSFSGGGACSVGGGCSYSC
ncbi:hypothetical protein IJD34_02980 [bacterium]|nr:hypothetical protein [bacterium]